MALIACAPTSIDRVAKRWPNAAEAGAWRLTIRGKAGHPAPSQVRVSAWIERDEPGNAADPESTQSWLRCAAGSAFDGGPTATLTALAMGERTVTVGAYTARGAQAARLWPDSAWGLHRLARDHRGPTLVAAGERIVAPELRGIATAGNISTLPTEASGTSIAAAWVTRCALNVVTRHPKKASKAELLKHWGVDPKAQPTEPRGHGALLCDGTLNPHVPP